MKDDAQNASGFHQSPKYIDIPIDTWKRLIPGLNMADCFYPTRQTGLTIKQNEKKKKKENRGTAKEKSKLNP